MVTPSTTHTIKSFLLLCYNCNLATVMNCNVNLSYAGYLIRGIHEGLFNPQEVVTNRLRATALERFNISLAPYL